jgi:glycosyltransferase involved in cell wall biosynthesis
MTEGIPTTMRATLARLSVVVPAFNEQDGIGPTLRDLAEHAPGAEVIVVDDGSTDRTAEVALSFPNVIVVQHPFNRGYGAALKTGMSLATRELVAWFDADHEHPVADLVAMAGQIERGRAAVVIAQRRRSGPSPMRTAGKFVISMLARSLDFRGGKDINCGLRVFRREVIARYLDLLPNGFSASITSTMIVLERGYPVEYHPIELARRIGQSKVKVGDGFRALILVLRTIMLFAPMRIFLRFGLLLFGLGLLYGVIVALREGLGFPAVAVVVMIIGVISGFFGLVADQISQMRLAAYDRPIYRIVSAARPAAGD